MTASITDVLYVVRSGKEATVYCCRSSAGGLVAAKVYRPLERRNFHNDAVYQVGRDAPMSSRDKRALANKSRHGRDLQYGSWIHAEFEIMQMLYEAGADVPEVFGRSSGAILMEYLGDEDAAAPMLSRVTLPREQAEQFLRRISTTSRCGFAIISCMETCRRTTFSTGRDGSSRSIFRKRSTRGSIRVRDRCWAAIWKTSADISASTEFARIL